MKRFESDVNTWHIIQKGDESEAKGLLITYVDDIMVIAEEVIAEAMMKKIDQTWKCSEEEIVKEGSPPVSLWNLHREESKGILNSSETIHQGASEETQDARLQRHKYTS